MIGGNLGDTSPGGAGITGGICAGTCGCGAPWLQGGTGGMIAGGGARLDGCLVLLR